MPTAENWAAALHELAVAMANGKLNPRVDSCGCAVARTKHLLVLRSRAHPLYPEICLPCTIAQATPVLVAAQQLLRCSTKAQRLWVVYMEKPPTIPVPKTAPCGQGLLCRLGLRKRKLTTQERWQILEQRKRSLLAGLRGCECLERLAQHLSEVPAQSEVEEVWVLDGALLEAPPTLAELPGLLASCPTCALILYRDTIVWLTLRGVACDKRPSHLGEDAGGATEQPSLGAAAKEARDSGGRAEADSENSGTARGSGEAVERRPP